MPNRAQPLSHHHVFEPPTAPDARPLLLLHGTGGDERDLLRIGRVLSPSGALLSPRGDVSEAGALRFFARIAEGVFDPAEITRRTHALADFVESAAQRYGLDLNHLTAVGLSNGANIAATLLLLRPATLSAAILFRPMVVLDQAAAPGSLEGKAVLITHGSTDPLVPPDHPERLAALLRAGGAAVQVRAISASHALTPQDLAAAQSWISPG